MTQAAVLFSGGVDSTIVAAQLAATGQKLLLITANLGKPLVVDYAKQVGRELEKVYPGCIDEHIVVDLGGLYQTLRKGGKNGYIPGYHMIYSLAGMALADKHGLDCLYLGYALNTFTVDREEVRDTEIDSILFREILMEGVRSNESSKKLFRRLSDVYGYAYHMNQHSEVSISFETPIYYMTKPERMKLGAALRAPMEYSITCVGELEPLDPEVPQRPLHCGKSVCYFCNQRKAVVALSGMLENTRYMVDEPMEPRMAAWVEKALAKQ